jgi:hypothetical protein
MGTTAALKLQRLPLAMLGFKFETSREYGSFMGRKIMGRKMSRSFSAHSIRSCVSMVETDCEDNTSQRSAVALKEW